jgi:hypothetical protein
MESDVKGRAEPAPPLWPWLLLCLGVAVWIDFGTFHRMQHADSIVPVLTSLYHWTFYYWHCNRIGQLLPLLAMPFPHPLTNLLVQTGLGIFLGLAGFFLLARYLYRDRSWPLVASASLCAFLLLTPAWYQFTHWVGYQPYAPGIALGLGALVALVGVERRAGRVARVAAALVLSLLAHWVFIGSCLILGPLVVTHYLFCRRRPASSPAETAVAPCGRVRAGLLALLKRPAEREALTALAVLALGWGCMMVVMSLAPYAETDLGAIPRRQWPDTFRRLFASLEADLQPNFWSWLVLAGVAGGALLLLLWRRTRPRALPAAQVFMAAAVTALGYGLFIGTRAWIPVNGYAARYWFPAVFVLQFGLVGLLAAPLCGVLGRRGLRALCWACAPVLLLVACRLYGTPSADRVRYDIDCKFGVRSADIIATGTTHVWGDYWSVWPAVFHANMVLHESGSDRRVHGLTFRSWCLVEDWNRAPLGERRLARAIPLPAEAGHPVEDRALEQMLGCPLRQLRLIEKRPFLDVYRTDDRVVLDAKTDLLRLCGHARPDGWAAEPGREQPGFLTHGPYLSVPPGAYLACFRLMVRDLPQDERPVLRLDVCNARPVVLLAQRELTGHDFRQGGRYHNVYVPFTLPGWNNAVEFRTAWHGTAYVQQESVTITPAHEGPFVFEPQDLEHGVGQADGDAWAAQPGPERKEGCLSSSPGLALPPGSYTATFRLRTRDAGGDCRVGTVEAVDVRTGKVLARRDLLGRDFRTPGACEEVALPFTLAGSDCLIGLRVQWHNKAWLRHERVTVVGAGKG